MSNAMKSTLLIIAGQIIEHHNGLLDQFSAGNAAVTVTPASAVAFS